MSFTPQERWLIDHGLAYFVDSVRDKVYRRLSPARLIPVAVLALVAASAIAYAVVAVLPGTAVWSLGLTIAAQLFMVFAGIYALFALRAWSIITWAVKRTFESLGQLYPLLTKALPMLMVFMTFLFINAEVWQVGSDLNATTMLLVVSVFTALALLFLYARIHPAVEEFDNNLERQHVVEVCEGSPFAEHVDLDEAPGVDEPLGRMEEVNLILAMLVTQVIQVVMLSVAVWGFFLAFGMLAINDDVIKSWTHHEAKPILWGLLNQQVLRVATFLSAFAGFYFIVTAVNDDAYRKEFFGSMETEVKRALGWREVYRAVRRTQSLEQPQS